MEKKKKNKSEGHEMRRNDRSKKMENKNDRRRRY